MPNRRQINVLGEEAEILVQMDLGRMWDRYLGEFLDEWERLSRQRLSPEDMEAELLRFMEGLSDNPLEDLARTTSDVAYNQGRSAEILTAQDAGEATQVVRSEILDENTCQVCADLDGAVFEIGTDDYYTYMPPAQCLGGDRCRGFYVVVA